MKKKVMFLVLMLASLLMAGCSVESKVDYVNNARQLTFGTQVCTLIVASGQADMPAAATMVTSVHAAHKCSLMWYGYIKDANSPPPDVVLCATSSVIDLLAYQKQYNIDLPPPRTVRDVNEADIEAAKIGLDYAVQRFDKVVHDVFAPRD